MQIISISGLDGSGKSTQINLLKEYLEKQGKKVFYFHAVTFSIAQKIGKAKTAGESKSVSSATWLQIQLRKLALVIDLFRFKSFTRKLTCEGYDYLLSDRYFYDSVINIAYLSNTRYKLQDTRYKLIPRPDHAFYLSAEPENIMKRDRIPDQGLEYLQKKKALLDAFSKENNLIAIDGNRDKEEIFEEIRSAIL